MQRSPIVFGYTHCKHIKVACVYIQALNVNTGLIKHRYTSSYKDTQYNSKPNNGRDSQSDVNRKPNI